MTTDEFASMCEDGPDPATVYRDTTYSAKTQAELKELLHALVDAGFVGPARCFIALVDVIDRWDANDATEEIFV